jgi:hypothetical protein
MNGTARLTLAGTESDQGVSSKDPSRRYRHVVMPNGPSVSVHYLVSIMCFALMFATSLVKFL